MLIDGTKLLSTVHGAIKDLNDTQDVYTPEIELTVNTFQFGNDVVIRFASF